MHVSELCQDYSLDLRCDARFASLGFVDIALDQRLVFAMDQLHLDRARTAAGVAAILTTPHLADGVQDGDVGLACTRDPKWSFVEIHNALASSTRFYGADEPTRIDPSARLESHAVVDPIGVTIGPGCRIDAGAVVRKGTRLKADIHVMSGAVLGSDGFQTMRLRERLVDLRHAGGIDVDAGTTIMANAVVARAVFKQSTQIGADCRIGNGAFISHNVKVGPGSLVGHGAVIAGNCTIGERVTIGPSGVCLDRLSIGDGAFVTAGAVVARNVSDGERVTGNLAVSHSRFLHFWRRLRGTATRPPGLNP